MPFHFKKSEPVPKAVRRMCRERIGAALDLLQDSERPAAVHGVRKEIKKLRALFRLVRGEIGRGTYRKGAKALREVAGCLAAARDARVMLRAFEKLDGSSGPHRFPEIRQALNKYCRRETRRFRGEHSVVMANRILKQAGRRVDGLKIKTDGWSAIEPGLKRCYRRGRDACARARVESSPEHFHEWRKHVKDFWYYFSILSPALPDAGRVRTDELEWLGELLGEDHDLFLLQQFVAETGGASSKEAEALIRLIVAHQRRLRAGALRRGARLYAETPAVFCRRLQKYWEVWRGGKQ